jgi:hypothetical protein|tara:strand:+ start:80 stop:430 length:351 start_codon:yes stop_codon:yes gene_type:complete
MKERTKKEVRQIILVEFIAALFVWVLLTENTSPLVIPELIGLNFITLLYLLFTWIFKKRVRLIIFSVILWCSIGLGFLGNRSSQNRKSEIIEQKRIQKEFLNKEFKELEKIEELPN